MATNQVIVIRVKDDDGNEERYYNQSNILHDMLIEVESGDTNGTKTTFHVHHSVLKESSSIFEEILEADKDNDVNTLPFFGVNPNFWYVRGDGI